MGWICRRDKSSSSRRGVYVGIYQGNIYRRSRGDNAAIVWSSVGWLPGGSNSLSLVLWLLLSNTFCCILESLICRDICFIINTYGIFHIVDTSSRCDVLHIRKKGNNFFLSMQQLLVLLFSDTDIVLLFPLYPPVVL